MKCPTCEDAKENCCCTCGCEIPEKDRELVADPYAYEIGGCNDLHLQCDGCLATSRDEV